MNKDELLFELHGRGVDNETDFDDNLLGWFGWEVEGNLLKIHFTDSDKFETSFTWTLIEANA